ncbi:hypothetical protein VNO77_18909 [Canavalia gladiata]|uniref:Uncharacterized protein n=1 Tax=Canavalia gladiata TaxID=3824 RepID=A0AAN9LQ34_CANGL
MEAGWVPKMTLPSSSSLSSPELREPQVNQFVQGLSAGIYLTGEVWLILDYLYLGSTSTILDLFPFSGLGILRHRARYSEHLVVWISGWFICEQTGIRL